VDDTTDRWAVLTNPTARPAQVEQALAELTVSLFEGPGPSAAATAAVPRLVNQLGQAPRPPCDGAALVSLLSRLALGEHPWPAPADTEAHRAVREALVAEVPRLLLIIEGADARARHSLAHLLAWLGPSPAIDAALRERLKVEKYEAARASLLLALAVRGRHVNSKHDVALLRAQLAPNAPLRVAAAAAVGLCLLDAASQDEPTVKQALRLAADAAELATTELTWNRGDLRAMAKALAVT
jgi:hypothetical protein